MRFLSSHMTRRHHQPPEPDRRRSFRRPRGSTPDPIRRRVCCSTARTWCAMRDRRACSSRCVAVAASRLTSQTEEGLLAQRLEREGIDVIASVRCRVRCHESGAARPSGIVAIARRQTDRPPRRSASSRTRSSWPRSTCRIPATSGALMRAAEAGGVTGALIVRRVGKSVLVEGAARQHGQRAAAAGRRRPAPRDQAVDADAHVAAYARSPRSRAAAAIPTPWTGAARSRLLLGGEGPA